MVWGFSRVQDHFCSSSESKVTSQTVWQVWLDLEVFYLIKKIEKTAIRQFYVVKSKENDTGKNAQDSLVLSKLRYCEQGCDCNIFCHKMFVHITVSNCDIFCHKIFVFLCCDELRHFLPQNVCPYYCSQLRYFLPQKTLWLWPIVIFSATKCLSILL